jgi:hypothetical protein
MFTSKTPFFGRTAEDAVLWYTGSMEEFQISTDTAIDEGLHKCTVTLEDLPGIVDTRTFTWTAGKRSSAMLAATADAFNWCLKVNLLRAADVPREVQEYAAAYLRAHPDIRTSEEHNARWSSMAIATDTGDLTLSAMGGDMVVLGIWEERTEKDVYLQIERDRIPELVEFLQKLVPEHSNIV